VAVRHERRALLVAGEHKADLRRRAQHVEDRQVHRAGDAEYVVDAFAAKAIDDRLRAGDHANLEFGVRALIISDCRTHNAPRFDIRECLVPTTWRSSSPPESCSTSRPVPIRSTSSPAAAARGFARV